MITYKINDVIETNVEDGIWLDFLESTWLFYVKDRVWTDVEIRNFKSKSVKLSFFQKGIVDGFLIDVLDVIETSDIPFCLLEATKELINTLQDNQTYKALILLIDQNNHICAKREGTLSNETSKIIKHALQEQLTNDYTEESFNMALSKLQNRYEPFELEEFVKVAQTL